jgi:hypothetical protein
MGWLEKHRFVRLVLKVRLPRIGEESQNLHTPETNAITKPLCCRMVVWSYGDFI